MLVFIYFLIGLALCALTREPEPVLKEERSIYMYQLLLFLTFWPVIILYRGFKRKKV
ncbi:hypothetical protein [Halobacillus mangrovi]|uniref:hypothetical protein n=1 Tax=Halobacillus mangrovi TaxID=402384 RepID=UPI0012F51C81|nr:hypothetical protein [Halobacillus mangrovi]